MFKPSRRLGTHWLVNAGLSEPRVSLRPVEAWCRDSAIVEGSPLSYETISQARDTFGQLLVAFNTKDMARYTDGITHGFVIVRRLHDEATMQNLSFCSSDDSELEMDPGTAEEESDATAEDTGAVAAAVADELNSGEESEPLNPRAARHTHTAWYNDYFVLTDNRQYPDVRMTVKTRWKGLAPLGRSCGSKTLVPGHYGDDRAGRTKLYWRSRLG